MRTAFFAFVLALASLPGPALATDAAAAAIDGAWVVSVGEQPRDRFLIVKGARTDRNLVLVDNAVYGWIDGRGKRVGDWRAEVFGDRIKLSFLTPTDSRIDASFSATDTSASGEMLTKGGRKYDVRMTRLDDEELAAMRAAAAGAAAANAQRPAVAKSSKISLVYVGADDCPSCRRFIGSVGDDGRGLKNIVPELAEAQFVYVHLGMYVAPVSAGDLPADMAWLIQPAAGAKPPLRKRGTPFFAAVVDRKVVAQGHGVAALETLVAPAIKRAVEARRAAP